MVHPRPYVREMSSFLHHRWHSEVRHHCLGRSVSQRCQSCNCSDSVSVVFLFYVPSCSPTLPLSLSPSVCLTLLCSSLLCCMFSCSHASCLTLSHSIWPPHPLPLTWLALTPHFTSNSPSQRPWVATPKSALQREKSCTSSTAESNMTKESLTIWTRFAFGILPRIPPWFLTLQVFILDTWHF